MVGTVAGVYVTTIIYWGSKNDPDILQMKFIHASDLYFAFVKGDRALMRQY